MLQSHPSSSNLMRLRLVSIFQSCADDYRVRIFAQCFPIFIINLHHAFFLFPLLIILIIMHSCLPSWQHSHSLSHIHENLPKNRPYHSAHLACHFDSLLIKSPSIGLSTLSIISFPFIMLYLCPHSDFYSLFCSLLFALLGRDSFPSSRVLHLFHFGLKRFATKHDTLFQWSLTFMLPEL